SEVKNSASMHSGRGHASHRAPTSNEDTSLNLLQIWKAIRRGKWIVLLTCVVVTGLISAYTLHLDPVYEASSIVAVTTRQSTQGALLGLQETRALSNEVGVLENSLELSERVVERL